MTAQSVETAAQPAAAEIVALTNALVGRIWAHFTARAAELNLSIAEAKALQQLDPVAAMPMRGLAARVHANPSNITVVVDRLEARGLVSREVSADRRVRGVRLTRAGLELCRRLEARVLADHPAVAGLSAAEQHRFLQLLRHLAV